MIRVAVVGVGGMGACHAQNVHDVPGAKVTWVADPDETAGTSLAIELDAGWTADGFDAIADCDAVIVASPDRFHADYVRAAFDAGLPVLCEKPMTVELSHAERIVEHEVAIGRRLLQLGFMRVYDQRHMQVSEALSTLGTVHHVRCLHRNTPLGERSVHEILVQSIIHDIHSVRWLARSEIAQVTTTSVHREGRVRFVLLTCLLENGGVATIEFDDAAAGYEVSVEVSADHGNVAASEPGRALVRSTGTVSSTIGDDWFTPFAESYRVEMRVWLDSIAAGATTGPSAWDGYAAQAVVEAATRSDRSGCPEPVAMNQPPSLYTEVAP